MTTDVNDICKGIRQMINEQYLLRELANTRDDNEAYKEHSNNIKGMLMVIKEIPKWVGVWEATDEST